MKIKVGLVLAAACFTLAGCGTTRTAASNRNYAAGTSTGLKPVSQVSPACRDFAAGKISLAECMSRPDCRQCALNSIQDLPPASR